MGYKKKTGQNKMEGWLKEIDRVVSAAASSHSNHIIFYPKKKHFSKRLHAAPSLLLVRVEGSAGCSSASGSQFAAGTFPGESIVQMSEECLQP